MTMSHLLLPNGAVCGSARIRRLCSLPFRGRRFGALSGMFL
jgi:hypothetical protein